jgi:hypothetical protein
VKYSSTVLDLGTRWRCVARFTLLRLYPLQKGPRYPLSRRPNGPQSRSRRCGIEKIIVAYRPVAREKPRNKQRVQPLLCNRRINKTFLGNGSVNSSRGNKHASTTIELLSEILGFRTLSIVLVLKNKLRKHLTWGRKQIHFPKRRVSLVCFLIPGRWIKSETPISLKVIHHRQNPIVINRVSVGNGVMQPVARQL